MFCTVYRLRHFGDRLPIAEVQARSRVGRLRVADIPGTSQPRAELLDPRTNVQVDEIRSIKLVKVDHGILIAGYETHPGRGPTRQTWWCVPVFS